MGGFSPVRDGSACLLLLLLLLGRFALGAPKASEVDVKVDLDCSHDYEKMSCKLKAQSCSEYSLTLQNKYADKDEDCPLQLCGSGTCCCSVKILLIPGEKFIAQVRTQSSGKLEQSRTIEVFQTFKPRTPTIVSVNESNGNYEVRWRTNMESRDLSAEITCYKKGDTEKVSKPIRPALKDDLQFYEISGQHLEPDTTYVVSVRSVSDQNDNLSDSSEEKEFQTSPSNSSLLLGLIIGLSVCVVIISTATYGCCVKHRNIQKYSKPKLNITPLSKPPFIHPEGLYICSVYVEPLIPDDSKQMLKELHGSQSPRCTSVNSSGSSKDNYGIALPPDVVDVTAAIMRALGSTSLGQKLLLPTSKDFFKDSYRDSAVSSAPHQADPSCVRASNASSGSSGLFNQTYSMLLPNSLEQKHANGSAAQLQSDTLSDSACCSDTSGASNDANRPSCLLPAQQDSSSLVPRNASDPPCRADALRFLHSDFAGLGKMVVTSENPVYGSVPLGSHQFLPMRDDYQPVQCKTETPDFFASEERSGGSEQCLIRRSGETFQIPQTGFTPFVPDFLSNASSGPCRPELQLPFLQMMPSDKTIKVIADYQSV